MRGSAPAADRPKIDAHLETIRTIENRLSGAAAACKPPAATGKLTDSIQNMPKSLDAYSDLATAAMACDLTRVVSYQITKGDNDGAVYGFLGMTEGHHDISHKGDSDTQARANLTKIYTFFAERVAYLLKSLDAIPEGSGTMLDNTLVVWGSEIAKGNTHAFSPIPFVMARGAGGAIATGRFQTFPKGTAHNRLLVTICRAFGLASTQTFGTSDKGTGPLPGVLA